MKEFAILAVLLLLVAGLAVGAFFLFAPAPRRWRAFARAQRLLQQGDWQAALVGVEAIPAQGLSTAWQAKLANTAGEAYQLGGDQLLQEKNYDTSLHNYLTAAHLLGLDENEQRSRVVEKMLADARKLFATGGGAVESNAILQLLVSVFSIQPLCPEASFWQGLCYLRLNQFDAARIALTTAHEGAGRVYLDPALYLGMMHIRAGQFVEGIRFLAEANRVDAGCAFVTLQMGIALVGGSGDVGTAVRTLQRALGPKGFGQWAQTPERAWVEACPEGHSYVRRLATKYPFVCPLLGGDLDSMTRQGRLALAQALYRQGNFQESADLYAKLLGETPPTAMLLRGLGLALARLGRYDQAYKHLRTALEQEEPKDPFTAGYLALCGAMGKPTQPEDKPRNVLWALKLIARFHPQMAGNAEWASLANTIHAEARALGLDIPIEDQVFVCDALASVRATDPPAAEAYAYLFKSFPDALQPIHAYLYCQSSLLHRLKGDHDLALFARAFQEPTAARAYFVKQKWDFDDLEYAFLERSAAKQPGRFPEVLGPEYAAQHGEAFLLARSRAQEDKGNKDAATTAVEVLLRLAPTATAAHDRLACLHYRRGDLDRAVALLSGWQRLAPHDPWPLIRQAIIEQQRGNAERRAKVIDEALGLTHGPIRAAVAFLGARLALQAGFRPAPKPEKRTKTPRDSANGVAEVTPTPDAVYAPVQNLLEECLRADPQHVEAQWCLAAVRACLGDEAGLATQAAAMNRPSVKDARFHYLGAVCHLAAHDYNGALELSRRAAADQALAVESHYLMAWAHLHLNDSAAASQALQKVVTVKTPSADHARALLGKLSYARGDYDDAIKWWNAVDAGRRVEWQFEEPLRQTVYLAGLTALEKQRYEQAADRFREAGKLGLSDKRLGGLLTLALIKAGQRLLFEQAK